MRLYPKSNNKKSNISQKKREYLKLINVELLVLEEGKRYREGILEPNFIVCPPFC